MHVHRYHHRRDDAEPRRPTRRRALAAARPARVRQQRNQRRDLQPFRELHASLRKRKALAEQVPCVVWARGLPIYNRIGWSQLKDIANAQHVRYPEAYSEDENEIACARRSRP